MPNATHDEIIRQWGRTEARSADCLEIDTNLDAKQRERDQQRQCEFLKGDCVGPVIEELVNGVDILLFNERCGIWLISRPLSVPAFLEGADIPPTTSCTSYDLSSPRSLN
jgi:hypothetical protein